jgi:peroxiredoxin
MGGRDEATRPRRNARARRVALVAVIAAAVVAAAVVGVARARSTPTAGAINRSVPAVPLIPSAERVRAPDFSLQTATSGTFELAAQRSHPVVITFLASGCESCAAEVSALKRAYSAVGPDGAKVLLVDVGGLNNAQVLDYYRGRLGGGPHLYAADMGGHVALLYHMRALGQTYVVDPDGRIAYADIDPSASAIIAAVHETTQRG